MVLPEKILQAGTGLPVKGLITLKVAGDLYVVRPACRRLV
jgi:hypothetical protein